MVESDNSRNGEQIRDATVIPEKKEDAEAEKIAQEDCANDDSIMETTDMPEEDNLFTRRANKSDKGELTALESCDLVELVNYQKGYRIRE